jgi:transcriptional antiterminator RfaH
MMNGCMSENPSAWYVIQTKPRQEFRALEQLLNQHYNCFLPTLKVDKVQRGKIATSIKPLFSRYLFIQLDTVRSNWSAIRSTRGVTNLVAFGGTFATLPDDCVAALRHAPLTLHQRLFEPGERIAISSGPFIGLEGIYQMVDGDARALVLLELISQPRKISLALDILRKAD